MTDLTPYLGNLLLVTWRDIASASHWTSEPLVLKTSVCKTCGWFVGFNVEGDPVLAGSHAADDDYGDVTVLPKGVIESVDVLRK